MYVCMYVYVFFQRVYPAKFPSPMLNGRRCNWDRHPERKKHINEAAKSQDMVVYTKQYPRDTHVKNRGLEHHPTKKGISSPT